MLPYDKRAAVPAAGPGPESPRRGGASHSKKKRSAGEAILDLLGGVIPKVGDSPLEIVRKCVFVVALVVLIGSVSYLLNDMVVQPAIYEKKAQTLRNLYTPGVPSELPPEAENYPFPEGMSDDFKALYMLNNDLRGYLIFRSTAEPDLFDNYISYPVLQTDNNDFYLDYDFNKTKNKQGALFFDYRNNITLGAKNKNLIVYGHNLSTGQMFTRLNRLITKPNKNYARSAVTLTMNTLYEQASYKVFAVMVVNNDEADGPPFRYLRTEFSDDADFLRFVAEIRARSIYDYDSVDVQASDELLMLSTCNGKGQVHFDDGRTVVVARKVRPGESASVDTGRINLNDDVIMPYAWYVNQGLAPHPYYTDNTIPGTGGDGPAPGTTGPVTPGTTDPAGPPTSDNSGTGPTTGPPDPGTTAPPPTTPGSSGDPGPSDTGAPPDPTDPADPTDPTDPAGPDDTTVPEDTTGPDDTTGPEDTTATEDTTVPDASSAEPTEETSPTEPAPAA